MISVIVEALSECPKAEILTSRSSGERKIGGLATVITLAGVPHTIITLADTVVGDRPAIVAAITQRLVGRTTHPDALIAVRVAAVVADPAERCEVVCDSLCGTQESVCNRVPHLIGLLSVCSGGSAHCATAASGETEWSGEQLRSDQGDHQSSDQRLLEHHVHPLEVAKGSASLGPNLMCPALGVR